MEDIGLNDQLHEMYSLAGKNEDPDHVPKLNCLEYWNKLQMKYDEPKSGEAGLPFALFPK